MKTAAPSGLIAIAPGVKMSGVVHSASPVAAVYAWVPFAPVMKTLDPPGAHHEGSRATAAGLDQSTVPVAALNPTVAAPPAPPPVT
jgi:hypothetical protein